MSRAKLPPLQEHMLRGVWCEIATEHSAPTWVSMHREGDIYVFDTGFQELALGWCLLTFYRDGKQALRVEVHVEITTWLATSFWIDRRRDEPDLPFPACRVFHGDLELFKVSPAAVI